MFKLSGVKIRVLIFIGVLLLGLLGRLAQFSRRPFLLGFTHAIISSPYTGSDFVFTCGPVFNQFPVSYEAKPYSSKPLIDGRNVTQNGALSNSAAEHDRGIKVEPGDVVEIYIYFHNGGLKAEDCPDAEAIRTVIQATANPLLGVPAQRHYISGMIRAVNAPAVYSFAPGKGGDLTINIQGGVAQSLRLVPGSVQQRGRINSEEALIYHLPDEMFEGGIDLGMLGNGLESAGFVVFQLEVSDRGN